ncbi:MAG: VacJ family lipoprotein [Desulfosalsimonadaceae bacterium]|nr:VacJ family lipoprotein [Desulfosalsimonadaceae bacterium]
MLKHLTALMVWVLLPALFPCMPSAFAVELPTVDAGNAATVSGMGQTQPADLADDSAKSAVPAAASDGEAEFDEFGEFEDAAPVVTADPLGGYNRFMTGVNDYVYVWALRPVARGYRFVVIKPARLAIARVFTNASYPIRCVNNLLQLKIRRAGEETGRFIVNTTLGVGGLFDPATTCMKMNAWPEDFGQTLGHYGLGSGCHIVLPLMGPSNLRDAVAFLPDTFLQPVNYVEDDWTAIGLNALNRLNTLSLFMDDYDALRAEALDLYVFQRDAYEMKRKKEVEK